MTRNEHLYMLFAYPKNRQDDLSSAQREKLKSIVERWCDG